MTTRDWNAIRTEYIASEISLRELARKYEIVPGSLLGIAGRENWKDERETYRAKLNQATLHNAEERGISARQMAGDAVALSFRDYLTLPSDRRGERFPELLRLWAALTGETTERSEVRASIEAWRSSRTAEEIAAVEAACRLIEERGVPELPGGGAVPGAS